MTLIVRLWHTDRMPFKGQYTSLRNYTPEEIARYAGKVKKCPRCGEVKEVISGFGLRRPYDPPNKKAYVMPRVHCRACDTKESNRRRKENNHPSDSAAARMVEWKRTYYAPKSEFRKKFLARSKSRYHFKKRMPCEVAGCEDLGERHHENYDLPLNIRWLCRRHHRESHVDGQKSCRELPKMPKS